MLNDHEARCPYCYQEQNDSYEWIDRAKSNEIIVACDFCDEEFVLSVDVTVHYYTNKLETLKDKKRGSV